MKLQRVLQSNDGPCRCRSIVEHAGSYLRVSRFLLTTHKRTYPQRARCASPVCTPQARRASCGRKHEGLLKTVPASALHVLTRRCITQRTLHRLLAQRSLRRSPWSIAARCAHTTHLPLRRATFPALICQDTWHWSAFAASLPQTFCVARAFSRALARPWGACGRTGV